MIIKVVGTLFSLILTVQVFGQWKKQNGYDKKLAYQIKVGERVLYQESQIGIEKNNILPIITIVRNKKAYILRGGKEFGPYKGVSVTSYDANGKDWSAYVLDFNNKSQKLSNGVVVNSDSKPRTAGRVYTSPNKKAKVTITGKRSNEYYLTFNNKKLGPYLYRPYPIFNKVNSKWYAPVNFAKRSYGIVINGKQYGPYDKYNRISHYRKTGRLVVVISKNKKSFILDGQKKFGPFENVSSSPRIYNRGRSWVASIQKGRNWYFLINGRKKLGPYKRIRAVTLSPNGKSFGAIVSKKKRSVEQIIINGRKVASIKGATSLRLSSNSRKWVVVSKIKKKSRKSRYGKFVYYVNVGRRKYGPYKSRPSSLAINKRGNKWGMVIRKNKKYIIYNNGRKKATYDSRPVYTYKEKLDAWYTLYSKNRKHTGVLKGKKYGPFSSRPYLRISKTGKFWSFRAKINGKTYYIVNGKKYGPFKNAYGVKYLGNESAWMIYGGSFIQVKNRKFPAKNAWSSVVDKSGKYFYWFNLEGKKVFINRKRI